MARKTDKQKAQELVDEVDRLYLEAKTSQEKIAWAKDALPKMKKAIELDPKNAEAWNNQGGAKSALGDYQGAIDDCTKAIEIDPKHAAAWHNRGAAKSDLSSHRNAIDDFTKAIEIKPEVATTWSGRGLARSKSGDQQGAIDDCTRAIEIDPESDSAWNNRGNAKRHLEDYQGALDDYNEAIELNSKNDGAWNNRGGLKDALGDQQGAIDDYTKAIQLNPKHSAPWHNRGAVKFRLGKYDDAIKDFDEALGLDPTNTHTQQYRQGAEIAKLRKESGQNAIENRNKSTEVLNKELKLLRRSLLFYRRARISLFFVLFYIIFTHLWAFDILLFGRDIPSFIALPSEDSNSLNIFLSALSRFSILSLVIFPIIWGIRLLNAAIIRNEVLKWDIFSRMNIANSIDYYQRELGDKRNDIIIAYMEGWINKNPADKLINLHSKNPAPTEQSSHETLLRELKNSLERLIRRNNSED